MDKITYRLAGRNYHRENSIKKQIILAHTSSSDMGHMYRWNNRLNGNNKKTAAFTITRDGLQYEHFDPSYYADFTGNIEIDKKSIVILLENDGWLFKTLENNVFINWIGNIYNQPDDICLKKWRGFTYWAPYTEKQVESTLNLVNDLCNEFQIPKVVVSNNVKIDDAAEINGVLYRSNLERHFTDLNPSWPFKEFKTKLEQ